MPLGKDVELRQVIDTLGKAQTIAIFMHINVDCDAMGSSLALKNVLVSLGKQVDVFVNSEFPSSFHIYGNLDFINQRNCEKYDLSVCLDCSTEARIGKYRYFYKKNAKNTLLIDHHVAVTERYCKLSYVKESSSTAEILFDVIMGLGGKFTADTSKFLLTGIITDTGKFTHTVTPNTFEVASKLLAHCKLRVEDICDTMFNSMSMGTFNLIKLAYHKIEFYCKNKLALIMFSKQDFIENDTNMNEIDGLADLPLEIEQVKFAILASEDDKGYFRVSLRSKGQISSRLVAESFGGGGHFNASGCKIFGEYDEVKQRLIDATCSCLGWKK